MIPAQTTRWQSDQRAVEVPSSNVSRVLVVPESINPGWSAHTADGTALAPITVNGWQQGWVVPPDTSGTVTLAFTSNTPYRVGLFGGLALLPLLVLLTFLPVRRRSPDDGPAQPWRPGPRSAGAAALGLGFVVSGFAGIAVVGAAIGVRYLLRGRAELSDAATLGSTAIGLTLAGAVLSRYPWRSVDGYIGHAWGVQLLALISVAALVASVVPVTGDPPMDGPPRP